MVKEGPASDVGADILLVTVTAVEAKATLEVFGAAGHRANPQSIGGRVYFDLGVVNGARVRMTRCEMGAGGLGASLQAVEKGIAALSPAAVIMVGIAFGVREEQQSIGDVLVSEQLRPYDLQRVGTRPDGQVTISLRDDKPHASPWLLNLLKSCEVMWEGPTLRFGTVLTGPKLVDNLDFREQLHTFEPEAIGGEMEGAGLYVACHDRKVDWILVKAICDFADGQKAKDKAARQALAAKNSAAFVYGALQFVKVNWEAHHSAGRPMAVHIAAPPTMAKPSDVEVRVVEWRKQCAEQLWRAVLAIRGGIPSILFDLDYVAEDEYPGFMSSNRAKEGVLLITDDSIARGIFLRASDGSIEDLRPVIGEPTWEAFSSYQSFLARACLVTAGKLGAGGPWYGDSLCLRLLSQALTPAHVAQLSNLAIGKFSFARTSFESSFLERIRSMFPDGILMV